MLRTGHKLLRTYRSQCKHKYRLIPKAIQAYYIHGNTNTHTNKPKAIQTCSCQYGHAHMTKPKAIQINKRQYSHPKVDTNTEKTLRTHWTTCCWWDISPNLIFLKYVLFWSKHVLHRIWISHNYLRRKLEYCDSSLQVTFWWFYASWSRSAST